MWDYEEQILMNLIERWIGKPVSRCCWSTCKTISPCWASQITEIITTKTGERLSTSNLIVHKGCIIRWKPNYLENLDHFKSWLYETESDFANKTSLTSLSEMKKFCWWLKEDLLMGTYCVLIVLIPWPLMTICLTPNDTHDTQSAYMGEYMRGLGI